MAWESIGAVAEPALLSAGGFCLFRRWGDTVSESAGLALVTTWMLLSFLGQAAVFTGTPCFSTVAEAALLLASAALVLRHDYPRQAIRTVRRFISDHRAAALLAVGWFCLLVIAVWGPPSPLGEGAPTPWPGGVVPGFPAAGGVSLNQSILLRLPLLSGGTGGGGIGFTSYIAIACFTYALSRRYAWPPTAFTVALVVAAMPRLVFLSAATGTELLTAATGLFCLLTAIRLVETPDLKDLVLLIWGILFSISADPLPFALPAVLSLSSAVMLHRRHGLATWTFLLRSHPAWASAAAVPALVFSQAPTWSLSPGGLSTAWAVAQNPDGPLGALGNLGRYLIAAVHLPAPADDLCAWMFGFRITGLLRWIHQAVVIPVAGARGTAVPFEVAWRVDPQFGWFGPFAVALILPAILFSLVRGHRRLKTLAVALLGYAYIIILALSWTPENVRLFTPFFACGGFFAASVLPPWRFTRGRRRFLQGACLLLLFHGILARVCGADAAGLGPVPPFLCRWIG